MGRLIGCLFVISSLSLLVSGCTTAPKTEEARENLSDEVQTALNRAERADVGLSDFLGKSAGYVVFPNVGKGGIIVGGAYGHGHVFEGGRMSGYADIRQGSVGLQAGGQEYSEILVFGTPEALTRFKSGKLEFNANASAVALKAGASSTAHFEDGVAVFTMAKGGLMFEASVAGQKFTYMDSEH